MVRIYLVPVREILAPAQDPTQTFCFRWPMVANVVIGQMLWGGVFSEAARRVKVFQQFFFFSRILAWNHCEDNWNALRVLQCFVAICWWHWQYSNLNSACITSNAIFPHFIFDEVRKIHVDSIRKLLQISLRFFLQVKVHNVYFKSVPDFVDIRFTSWHKVMKKIKCTSQNAIFHKKESYFENFTMYKKKNAGAVLRVTYIQTISQNKKRKSDAALRNWIKNI